MPAGPRCPEGGWGPKVRPARRAGARTRTAGTGGRRCAAPEWDRPEDREKLPAALPLGRQGP
eukprot:4265510-Lingulodinium_polyedra.AAC.1